MNGYDAIPYGRKWAVRNPKGLVRCVVDDKMFAKQIAYECAAEKSNVRMSRHNHPVQCIETGETYLTATEAAHTVGLSRGHTVAIACKKGTTAGGYHWRSLREELE